MESFSGSTAKVKKVVSTTTHIMDNEEPVVEVTISPMEMERRAQTTSTTNRTTSRTTSRSERDTSTEYSDIRSPRSPNGYLVDESTARIETSRGTISLLGIFLCSFIDKIAVLRRGFGVFAA